ncbi:MAG: hypothetical protein ABI556_15325 [Gemmatimonadales bacterium]
MTYMSDGKGNSRKYPPFAVPTGSPEVPSIGEFLDELPSITEFLAAEVSVEPIETHIVEELPAIDRFAPDQYDAAGWAISDWQSFDWSSLGSLAPRTQHAAAEADWKSTEWAPEDDDVYGATEDAYEFSSSDTGANEVAAALNEIAERIRSGELAIDKFDGIPPEAVIAAALAALLKMRR